jgi:hypothetical protein
MTTMPYIETIKRRHEAFWRREIVDRVCIAVTAPIPRRGQMPVAKDDEELLADPDFAIRSTLAHIANTYYAGDAIALGYAQGNLLYPAFGGAGRFDDGTVWVDPSLKSFDEWADYRYDPANIWIERFLRVNKALAEHAQGRYMVGTQGFFGATDALALIRGYEDFVIELCTEEREELFRRAQSEAIRGHKDIITRAWNDVEAWQQGTATIPGIWAPGRINYWSADFSCLIGPDDCRRWLLPEMKEMIDLCEFSIYHLDGPDAVRHLPLICEFEDLDAIQYTVGPQVREDPSHWIGVMKEIQKRGKATWALVRPDEVEMTIRELEPEGLFLSVEAASPEEADWLVKQAALWTVRKG